MQPAPARRADAARKGETGNTAPSPVRILVQTYTHLVPGEARPDKLKFLRNTIATQVLKTTYNKSTDFMQAYDDLFAVPGRQCFFLYDHAATPVGDDVADDAIPLLWYRWTGDKLIALNQTPPGKIRVMIRKDYPFMIRTRQPKPQGSETHGLSKAEKEELKKKRMQETPEARAKRRRELLQAKLRRLDYLFLYEHDWLAEEPAQEAWLKENLEPRAWSWYQSLKVEWSKSK